MIGRCPHEGQSERDVHPAMEVDRLDRNQRLIVIHAERRIIGLARVRVKHRVGGQRTAYVDPRSPQLLDGRFDDLDLLPTEAARLACVWIEPGDRKYWTVDAEVMALRGFGYAAGVNDRSRTKFSDRPF